MTAAEVFMSLRSKSILHLFASIGRFLGLEVNIYSLCFPFKVKWHWILDWRPQFVLMILVSILKAVKFGSCRYMSMVLLQLKYLRTFRMVHLCC